MAAIIDEENKIAEEARGHNMQNKVGMMNAAANIYQVQKEPNELTTLRGINADKELKDLYLGKNAQKDIDTAFNAYLKDHALDSDVMTRAQFEEKLYPKAGSLKVDDKTVNLVNQYLNKK